MGDDDLAALHGRALQLEAELDDVIRENDRLRLALGAPVPGQETAMIAVAVGVVLVVLAVMYVGISVPAHRRAVAETNAAGRAL
jgi:hypothetical protein